METETLLPKRRSGGLNMNWRRMRYQRLGGSGSILEKVRKKKMTKMVWLKGSRRYLRIKAIPKLRLVVRSPLKLLTKLKDAYIDLMLRFSGKVGGGLIGVGGGGDGVFGKKRIPKGRQVTDRFSMSEFEARLIFEISKVLVASRELKPM
ncbi:uncharacterized protein LOC129291999 [Prosopis cineraria]|uniref:uncharacterized protein LOC129291999 n=1 Tax=Prosopis cineraria TaxID=364024 RepID=UPI00240FF221|nr:uncharacterized protein LOC129291999 [Prosopis cineraria]